MPTPQELIAVAFQRLSARPGFIERQDQQQLALLLSDCISDGTTGSFEAPTGLGKSLAALIPAIVHAESSGKRTIIATYTNVLAEQYWRNDLPLALSLFDDPAIRTEFLIGRQRYACVAAINEYSPNLNREWRPYAQLGIESELSDGIRRAPREMTQLWQQISAPPVCPGRLCPQYHECYYYRARRNAEKANIVITNHSVVIQDALLRKASEGELSLLGDYDFLLIDEAHDFAQAAQNGLEFELSESKLSVVGGVVGKMISSLIPIANEAGDVASLQELQDGFKKAADTALRSIKGYGLTMGGPGILAAAPEPVWQHPQVKSRTSERGLFSAQEIAGDIALEASAFVASLNRLLDKWRLTEAVPSAKVDEVRDSLHNYGMYLREFSAGCESLFKPEGVAVSYAGETLQGTILRHDILGLAEPLNEILWSKAPWACMSATLALDGNFDFFTRTTGAKADFEEVLPTPFNYASQAAVYLPQIGAIPDPAIARKEGNESAYQKAVARQLSMIIESMGGRTLALFHSRKEMEAVRLLMELPPELPIFMQRYSGAASVGERFIREPQSSLFALRSFWTGFDAPGDTLSCVALVRVPFEVPIDPPQVARLAWLQSIGLDAFKSHSLPNAKMLMRQGAGRLIRRAEDRGVIALLDARLSTKLYGEEILANMPAGIRTFRDLHDAMAHVGLEVPSRAGV